MKNLFIWFTVFITVNLFAQKAGSTSNIVLWEADTKEGKFVGISESREEAEAAIDEIIFINDGSEKEVLDKKIIERSIATSEKYQLEDNFQSEDPFLTYRYFTKNEIIAMQYLEHQNVDAAVSFYTRLLWKPDKVKAKNYLQDLHLTYSDLLFDQQNLNNFMIFSK